VLKVAQIVFFAFAALLILGGIAGYLEKKSAMSLVAGVLCGGLALAGALQLASNPKLGLGLAIAGSILAAGGMGNRLKDKETGAFKVWPAGTVFIASLATLAVAVAAFATAKDAPAGAGTGNAAAEPASTQTPR
jgi:uncharacterized membrane protein (UPF0136 family)